MQSNADIINCKVQHRFLRDGSGRKFLRDNIDLYISMVQIRSLIIIPVIKPAMWLATAQDHSLSKLGPVSSRLQAVCPLHASTSSELPYVDLLSSGSIGINNSIDLFSMFIVQKQRAKCFLVCINHLRDS